MLSTHNDPEATIILHQKNFKASDINHPSQQQSISKSFCRKANIK